MADNNLNQYFKKGLDLLNQGKDFIAKKGNDLTNTIKKNMDEKAQAQNAPTQSDCHEKQGEASPSSTNVENDTQMYQANINKGKISLEKQERNETTIQDIASSQSVTSLVCGILALWTCALGFIGFLGIVPIILSIIGLISGKKAAKAIPYSMSMVARSGLVISVIALIISLIIFAYVCLLSYSTYQILRLFMPGIY